MTDPIPTQGDPAAEPVPPPKDGAVTERFRIERVAVTVTWGVVAGVIALMATGHASSMLSAAAVTTICLLSAIHTANFLFKFGGGFVERFPREQPPDHAKVGFSSDEYWREMLRLLGIVVAVLLILMLARAPFLFAA